MRRFLAGSFCACLALVGLAAASARAADDGTFGAVSFVVENDALFLKNRDRHYSNGLRVDWVPKRRHSLLGVTGLLESLLLARPDGATPRLFLQAGQNMYTPEDITRSDVVLDDRPFAGWLYLTAGTELATPDWTDWVSLTLGVVGPASLADKTQRWFHKELGYRPARGWVNQLRNEPGLVLSYTRQWHFPLGRTNDALLSLHPHLGASVGNVFTYAATGLTLQFGQGTGWRTPPRVAPALPGSSVLGAPADSAFGWALFVGIEGRAVARNLFLDGSTFRHSHSVPRKVLVGDLNAGLMLVLGHPLGLPPVRLSFSFTLRSKEFDGQDGTDRFASVSATVAY